MRKPTGLLRMAVLFLPLGLFGGCGKGTDSFEKATALEQAGKYPQAVAAYQDYLKHYPSTSLAARINYRIAKDYEASSDYQGAVKAYENVVSQYPQTDEALHALLDLGVLYQTKLKNDARVADYYRKAVNRYREDRQTLNAIQFLVEGQYQSANALFTQKDFKRALAVAEGIYQSYPPEVIAPETRARIDSLSDRAKRAEQIAQAPADLITVRQELPFDKGYEGDFKESSVAGGKNIPSPDGKYSAIRRKASNGAYCLFLGKTPAKGHKAVYKILPKTEGAEVPAWAPDGSEMVYQRSAGNVKKLEKISVKSRVPQTLYFTKSGALGVHPGYNPTGNKIAFIYAGNLWLINSNGTNKTLLKTSPKFASTADLSWSWDGTLIRCRQKAGHGKSADEVMVLDVLKTSLP